MIALAFEGHSSRWILVALARKLHSNLPKKAMTEAVNDDKHIQDWFIQDWLAGCVGRMPKQCEIKRADENNGRRPDIERGIDQFSVKRVLK